MTTAGVFFDMDGVLVDSLQAHLDYCERSARRLGVDVRVPSLREFRYGVVRRGTPISPMLNFFRALGFPERQAEQADALYRVEFRNEAVILFPGVSELLSALRDALDGRLGLATANLRNVVTQVLGDELAKFDARCIFAYDDRLRRSKSEALAAGAAALQLEPSDLLFVGDQATDFRAAQKAGCRFLGVTYGWGIDATDSAFPTVDRPAAILEHVRTR